MKKHYIFFIILAIIIFKNPIDIQASDIVGSEKINNTILNSYQEVDSLGQNPYQRNYKVITFDNSKWKAIEDEPKLTIEKDRQFVKLGYDSLKILSHPNKRTKLEYEFETPLDLSDKYINLWVYIPKNMMKRSGKATLI